MRFKESLERGLNSVLGYPFEWKKEEGCELVPGLKDKLNDLYTRKVRSLIGSENALNELRKLWRYDRYEGSISKKIKFLVEKMQPIIVISTPSESITIGESIRISGAITPKIASATISITYTKPNGDKVTRNILTDPDGNFQDSYPADTTGSWKVQVSYSGDDIRENAISNTLIITVNPPLVPIIIGLAVVIALATIVYRIWRSKKPSSKHIRRGNTSITVTE
jgi:hypothetical protein